MGCVSSKKDINDLHPNIFQVMNVDQLGNRISPGQLEITETDLVLYQRKKSPVKWPLRRLRRYGFEGELFSFESGRRCPTGPGIYAFHCLRAERLFNIVQAHIQVRNIVGDDGVIREFPAIGPVVPIRINTGIDASNYLEPAPFNPGNIRFVSQTGVNARRPGSVGSSNGPLSPQGTASPSPPPISVSLLPLAPPPPPPQPSNPPTILANDNHGNGASALSSQNSYDSYNNNKSLNQNTYINSASTVLTENLSDATFSSPNQDLSDCLPEDLAQSQVPPAYINVDLGSASGPKSPTFSMSEDSNYARLELGAGIDSQLCHLYMNVIPRPEIQRPPEWQLEEARHCYANLEPTEIEVARNFLTKRLSGSERLPPLPLTSSSSAHSPLSPPGIIRQVNYIVLDLDQGKKHTYTNQLPATPSTVPTSTLALPPEAAGKAAGGYATIDFNKTVALSHSVNPNVDNDSEGSRKTRHNSTINDITHSFE